MIKVFSSTSSQELEKLVNRFIKNENLSFGDDYTFNSFKYSISKSSVNDDMVTQYSVLMVINNNR